MQKGFALIYILVGLIIISLLAGGGYYFYQQQKIKSINSFEECAKHYPVMESYPEQCVTPGGKHFTRELSGEEKKKLEYETRIVPELNGFPVYPGARFIEKAELGPCPSGNPKGIICEAYDYRWETSEDYFRVNEWFSKDKSNSGWSCSGGAGSLLGPYTSGGGITCQKANIKRLLRINGSEEPTPHTGVSLVVPKSSKLE
jgi:hypothetical protein